MDDKTLSFSVMINGLPNEAIEFEKLGVQIRNMNKELKELEKLASKGLASNENIQKMSALRKEIGLQTTAQKELGKIMGSAEGSLNRMRAELIRLKNEYASASKEVREKMAPAVNKLNDEISKSEQAIGVYGRNVGNYTQSMSQGFAELGTKITSMVGPLALVAVAVAGAKKLWDGLKEAIMSTTFAIDLFNKIGAVTKQFFYDIAINGKITLNTLINASKIQGELNKLRVEEGFDVLDLSKINREEQAVRELSIDRTKTHTERLEYLNRVTELETEKTKIKVGHLKAELEAKEKLLKQQPANEKLALGILAIAAKINDTYAEEDAAMRRVNTQRTGFIQEEIDDRKKLYDAYIKEIDETNKKADELAKKKEKEALEEKKRYNEEWTTWFLEHEKYLEEEKEKIWDQGTKYAQLLFDQNKKRAEDEFEQEKKNAEVIAKLEQEKADAKFRIAQSATNLINGLAGKNKALQKASLIADKALAIAEIIIKTRMANAAMRANAALVPFPANVIAMVLAQAAILKNNISAGIDIAAVTAAAVAGVIGYAKGGKINQGFHVNTGSKDDTLIMANKTETVITDRHVAMLGGSGIMKRIGVPGYAEGGYIGSSVPQIPAAGFDYAQLARFMNSIEVTLNVNKLNDAQNELSIINETNKI